MGTMGQESDYKTKLVLDICSISTRSVACVHRLVSNQDKVSFIDWYCILGVEENAGINTIHKQYHKLALLLHPDKNKHPKAEIAFKLVSEANTCLSDAAKRKAFNLKRYQNFCYECNKIPSTSCNGSSFKAWNNISSAKSSKLWKNVRDMREKLKEEAKVIEKCLQANSMSKNESPLYNPTDSINKKRFHHRFEKEIPQFNPSNYSYQGYPHSRSNGYKNSETCWYLQSEKIVHNEKGRDKYSSPIFEVKSSQRRIFTSQFAYFPSRC
ncbi:hypothetical protein TanjilG_26540 [Lupinus angustifolius]|uniref:J domain-containing protein n=1 Tax=Lupinus angustifolius TaxID=3871 RepID=A0A4P1QPL4_LUPAN|nr:PREDICTED: J protein JJJ2-like [Lupinus angustifolius]OIV91687.1 hypothetical protein TanjilG_26540 [Lupinus angustifolius]